jgi:hypothetical protein
MTHLQPGGPQNQSARTGAGARGRAANTHTRVGLLTLRPFRLPRGTAIAVIAVRAGGSGVRASRLLFIFRDLPGGLRRPKADDMMLAKNRPELAHEQGGFTQAAGCALASAFVM